MRASPPSLPVVACALALLLFAVVTDPSEALLPATPAPPIVVGDSSAGVTPETGTDTAAQTPIAADFITPDPAECTVTPRTAQEVDALAASPDQTAVAALAAAGATPGLAIPVGQPADAEAVAAVEATFRQMVACFNAGNELAAFALWTDDALRQIHIEPRPMTAPTPVPAGERWAFRVEEVQVLPDGQVAAMWQRRDPTTSGSFVQILVRQDDRYVVDDTLDVMIG